MAYGRWYPTNTTLPDGRILAVGGSRDTISDQVKIPEVRGASGSWTALNGASREMPYYPFMFVAPNRTAAPTSASSTRGRGRTPPS
jgi:hypothetical protein